MPQHRNAFTTRAAGSPSARRHRWLIGAVAVVGASGLAFGSLGIPVLAGEINAVGNPHASADVQDGCVTVGADTGEADGGLRPHEHAQVQATGDGTATVSVCRDDLGGTPPGEDPDPTPGDPGDGLPGLEETVPDDLDDVVPGDGGGSPGNPGGELPDGLDDVLPGDGGGSPGDPGDIPGSVDDLVPGALGDVLPGGGGPGGGGPGGGGPGGGGPGGGGPGGGGPGNGEGVVPGLVGDGLDLVPDLLDRVGQLVPPAVPGGGGIPGGGNGGGGVPGGNNGGIPTTNPLPGGGTGGTTDVNGISAETGTGASPESVLGGEVEGGGATAPTGTARPTGATLPRTGGGLGSNVVRVIAMLGLGRAVIGLANRRRLAAGRA